MALTQVPAAQAGGMTLLSTTTLSGASTTISGIAQSYNKLFIVIENPFHSTGSRKMLIKPNATSSIADYTYNYYINGGTSSGGANASDLKTNIDLNTSTAPTRDNSALTITNYTDTVFGKPFHWFGAQTTSNTNFNIAGNFRTTSAISSLEFSTDGSGTYSGGQILIYGVK